MPGVSEELAAARTALLDALEALTDQLDALVLVGAQAIYLWTGEASVALAEMTDDSDIAIDRRLLAEDPRLEDAMEVAGFNRNSVGGRTQPGSWRRPGGVPVDLMLPEVQSDRGGRRGARIPPHSTGAVRRAVGLEATVVSYEHMVIAALDPADARRYEIKVARPGALMVAKLHKLGDREVHNQDRLDDKDAHDLYRLLVARPTDGLANEIVTLIADPLAGGATAQALDHLQRLFADGPEATGSVMAGRAEENVGEPVTVAAAVAVLAGDLLGAIANRRSDS